MAPGAHDYNIYIAVSLELDIDTILVGGVHDQDRLRRC